MDQATPQAHSRTLTYLLIGLGVVVVGAGIYGYFFRDRITEFFGQVTGNSNTVANGNSNNPALNVNTVRFTNLSLAEEVKGSTSFNGKLTFSGTEVVLSSFSRMDVFSELNAAAGKTFLVVYIDQVTNAQATTIVGSISSSVSLDTSSGTVPLRRYKIANDEVKNDRGYLLFEIPTTAKNLTIVNGTGPLAQRVALPS